MREERFFFLFSSLPWRARALIMLPVPFQQRAGAVLAGVAAAGVAYAGAHEASTGTVASPATPSSQHVSAGRPSHSR